MGYDKNNPYNRKDAEGRKKKWRFFWEAKPTEDYPHIVRGHQDFEASSYDDAVRQAKAAQQRNKRKIWIDLILLGCLLLLIWFAYSWFTNDKLEAIGEQTKEQIK